MSQNTNHLKNDAYLNTSKKLLHFIAEARNARVLAVDTEFMRERTFFPQLCLIQLAIPGCSVIVDPLVIRDLTPLKELFLAKDITKVFHAGDQDIEIIYQNLKVIPRPIFDTQIAAELLGLPQQTSLRNLVKEFADVRISKSDSFSNWGNRPLSESQINYALDDVRYLPEIFDTMKQQLEHMGRLTWLEEDFAALIDENRYISHPHDAWRKVKHSSSLNMTQLGVLREIAALRDRLAMKRNLPRKWVVSDELLVEIARLSPQSSEELFNLRGAENSLGQHWGKEMLAAIERGLALKPEELPKRESHGFRSVMNAAANDMLRVLVNQRSRDNKVTPSMLANKEELNRLASGEREGLRILSGWRYRLVGAELLKLLDGELSLRLDDKRVEVIAEDDQTEIP